MKNKYTSAQLKIITKLAFMYYAAGDVKDIWEGIEDMPEPGINLMELDANETLTQFCKAFNIKTEEEAIAKLTELEDIYQEPENFTLDLRALEP